MDRLESIFVEPKKIRVSKGILDTFEKDKKPYTLFNLAFVCASGLTETHGLEVSREDANVLGVLESLSRSGYLRVYDEAGTKMRPEHMGDCMELTQEGMRFLQENYLRAT